MGLSLNFASNILRREIFCVDLFSRVIFLKIFRMDLISSTGGFFAKICFRESQFHQCFIFDFFVVCSSAISM